MSKPKERTVEIEIGRETRGGYVASVAAWPLVWDADIGEWYTAADLGSDECQDEHIETRICAPVARRLLGRHLPRGRKKRLTLIVRD